MSTSRISSIVAQSTQALLDDWVKTQLNSSASRKDLINEQELRAQSSDFLHRFQKGADSGQFDDLQTEEWAPTIELLGDLSRQRSRMGFSPSETALFIFSLKGPLNRKLREVLKSDSAALVDEMTSASDLLDKLGLYTAEVFLKAREEVILRQQEDMLELSTPVVKLWEGIVALPVIGTLDSARTSVVMETLLQRIVETGSEIAIIDITGVPTVDTLVAQHLLKTVAAARLMGADCIISGIRPQIAQTMVHLAIDLSAVTTKASMAEALKVALERTGCRITRPDQTKAS
jgi:rsbT co-antagonist protein RsbR